MASKSQAQTSDRPAKEQAPESASADQEGADNSWTASLMGMGGDLMDGTADVLGGFLGEAEEEQSDDDGSGAREGAIIGGVVGLLTGGVSGAVAGATIGGYLGAVLSDNPEAEATLGRESLEGELEKLDELPEEEREAILERVENLEGDALVADMKMIGDALKAANPARAMHALAGVQGIINSQEGAEERLSPEVVAMMVGGVAEARTDSERGQEGILGAGQARGSAQALLDMSEQDYAATRASLGIAGLGEDGEQVEGSDAGAEQALILKAVSARQSVLSDEDGRADAMSDITGFASDIRGEERSELIRTTTSIDIDDANTRDFDPRNIAAGGDTEVDNDGMFQRFSDSCGPTSGQIIHAEQDPGSLPVACTTVASSTAHPRPPTLRSSSNKSSLRVAVRPSRVWAVRPRRTCPMPSTTPKSTGSSPPRSAPSSTSSLLDKRSAPSSRSPSTRHLPRSASRMTDRRPRLKSRPWATTAPR